MGEANSPLEPLRGFPVAVLCNAHSDVKAFGSSIRPLFQGARVFGLAKTAMIAPGQNAAIHRAVHTAAVGDVLVVSAGGGIGHGSFGDILAQACIDKGVTGLVMDGAVRDTEEIVSMKFPVFCSGANPTATKKSDPGLIDEGIECGNATLRPGDLISGDGDGVVVVPRELIGMLPERCLRVIAREKAIKEKLKDGKTTCEIFQIRI